MGEKSSMGIRNFDASTLRPITRRFSFFKGLQITQTIVLKIFVCSIWPTSTQQSKNEYSQVEKYWRGICSPPPSSYAYEHSDKRRRLPTQSPWKPFASATHARCTRANV